MASEYTPEQFEKDIHEFRSRFLDQTATIDIQLTVIISSYFLRKEEEDFPLFLDTVLDGERWAVFGQKIVWLGKILHRRFPNYEKRKTLHEKLEKLRILRNEFAHTFSLKPSKEDTEKRIVRLYDLKDGKIEAIERKFEEIEPIIAEMAEIMLNLDDVHELFKADRAIS